MKNILKYVFLFLCMAMCAVSQTLAAPYAPIIHVSLSDKMHHVPRWHIGTKSTVKNFPREVYQEQYFARYTTDDFAGWTQRQGFSADDLFARYELYQHESFRAFLRTHPEYEDRIVALHNKLQVDYDDAVSRACGYLTGNYAPGLRERVAQEFAHVQQLQAARQRQKSYISQQKNICAQQHVYTADHALQENKRLLDYAAASWQRYPHHQRLHKRAAAYQQVIQNNNAAPTHRTYHLDSRIQKSKQFTQEQIAALQSCSGSALQHVIHQEFVDITHQSVAPSVDRVLHRHFAHIVPEVISLGLEANNAGYMYHASMLADCCWAVLDCAHALAKGVADGCRATAQSVVDAISHPVTTATELVSSIATLAHTVASAASVVPELAYYYVTDTEHFYLRQHEIADYAKGLIGAINQHLQTTPRHELIRQSTAFVTQTLLTDRLLNACLRIATQIPPLLKHALPRQTAEPVYALITVPGRPLTRSTMDAAIPAILSDVGIAPEIALHKKIIKAADALGPTSQLLSAHLLQLEREVPQLVEYFNRACDWLRAHNLPVPKIDLMHLFGMELMPNKGKFKLGGFHHDYLGQLEKGGIIRLETLDRCGEFYRAQVWVKGIAAQPPKTFFPQSWTREQVINCITETYQTCMQRGIKSKLQPDGKYLLKMQLTDEIEIKFFLDQKMNIKTVYPVIKGSEL